MAFSKVDHPCCGAGGGGGGGGGGGSVEGKGGGWYDDGGTTEMPLAKGIPIPIPISKVYTNALSGLSQVHPGPARWLLKNHIG